MMIIFCLLRSVIFLLKFSEFPGNLGVLMVSDEDNDFQNKVGNVFGKIFEEKSFEKFEHWKRDGGLGPQGSS